MSLLCNAAKPQWQSQGLGNINSRVINGIHFWRYLVIDSYFKFACGGFGPLPLPQAPCRPPSPPSLIKNCVQKQHNPEKYQLKIGSKLVSLPLDFADFCCTLPFGASKKSQTHSNAAPASAAPALHAEAGAISAVNEPRGSARPGKNIQQLICHIHWLHKKEFQK